MFSICGLNVIISCVVHRCLYPQVTFAESTSVLMAMSNQPMFNNNGEPLTVTIAASNTKPRRAKFNVKHGNSGHHDSAMGQTEDAEKALLRTANIQTIKPAKLDPEDEELSAKFPIYLYPQYIADSSFSDHIVISCTSIILCC